MQVTLLPGRARGTVVAPPSKSMAHRLLVCAALSKGESVVRGISDSQDMLATLDCLSALGATYTRSGDTVRITGIDALTANPQAPLACRESGSTLRFMIPVALLSGNDTTLCGAPYLMQRPMGVYRDLCKEKSMTFIPKGQSITVKGPLIAGDYTVVGNISSQFISGLLFALPLVEGDSTISLIPPVESRSYLNLTVSALRAFGVEVEWRDELTLFIRGGQRYSPREIDVEGDYSNAAFLEAFNFLGGDVTVTGLAETSLQGDRVYRNYFEALSRERATLSIKDCPDLGPILFAVAAAKHGGVFHGTRRLRIKESDRAAAMAQELQKLGARATVGEDTVEIEPASLHAPKEPIHGHNDHRVVMSMAVLLSLTGGSITGAEAVHKSYPDFFACLRALGLEIRENESSEKRI